MGKQTSNRYVIKDREQSVIAESFRAIRASIKAAEAEGELKTLLFAGSSPGEGGAMTALNTAATLAFSGKKVILVDCDLRSPIIHDVLGLKNTGVVSIVREGKPLEQMIQATNINNLSVLTSGPLTENPLSLLSSERMRMMLNDLRQQADYVIIAGSPVLVQSSTVVSDACILAAKVDGVVLVIDGGTVRTHTGKKVLELLKGTRARIIGAILNNISIYDEVVYNAAETGN